MNVTSTVSTAKALAETFAAMRALGISDRRLFDGILRETLAQNPQYLGVWTVWEPNALDGRDRDFANAPGHDNTGRFIPLWNRGGGAIHLEPNVGYDIPGFGDWYLVPMQRREETVMDRMSFRSRDGRIYHQPGRSDLLPRAIRGRGGGRYRGR